MPGARPRRQGVGGAREFPPRRPHLPRKLPDIAAIWVALFLMAAISLLTGSRGFPGRRGESVRARPGRLPRPHGEPRPLPRAPVHKDPGGCCSSLCVISPRLAPLLTLCRCRTDHGLRHAARDGRGPGERRHVPVSCHDIAGIWVAFFPRCQRYRCRQVLRDRQHDAGEPEGSDEVCAHGNCRGGGAPPSGRD